MAKARSYQITLIYTGLAVLAEGKYQRFRRASEFMYRMSSGSRASGVLPNAVLKPASRSAVESSASGDLLLNCEMYEQKASFFMVARNETKAHACA